MKEYGCYAFDDTDYYENYFCVDSLSSLIDEEKIIQGKKVYIDY